MSRETLSPKGKAIDTECGSKRRKTSEPPCQNEPPSPWQLTLATIPEQSCTIKLKDEYVEPEHEELVRLTLSTGSSYPSPPERLPAPPLPESPPHPSLLQLMPQSSSSTPSLQPLLESLSHLSFSQLLSQFSQLLSQFPSPPGFPAVPSSQPSPQNGILTVQPPAPPALDQSLSLPSYPSQYIKPPPGIVFQPELRQQSPPSEPNQEQRAKQNQEPPEEQKQRSEQNQEPPEEQKQKPPSEQNQEQRAEQNQEPPKEQKQKPPSEQNQEQRAEQNQEPPKEQKQKPPSEQNQEQRAEQNQEPPEEQKQKPPSEPNQEPPAEGQARCRRPRNYKKPGWTATIEPPYPWATSSRAKVLSMKELLSQNITKIRGDLYCKECKKQFEIEYDLQSKFSEVVSFITENLEDMHDRAPPVWLKPEHLDCDYCNKTKCVQPLFPDHKRETNWLFLFLGQLIGHCNLTHLKHFCKHTNHHRTAAKDRLVFLTYRTLHLQLDPQAAELYDKEKD